MHWGVPASTPIARKERVEGPAKSHGGRLGRVSAAFAIFLAAPVSLALAQTAPAGMVPYDHPVFHNGKRVLWHWAGRKDTSKSDTSKSDTSKSDAAADSGDEAASSPAPSHSRKSIRYASRAYNFSVFSDGDDSCAFRMAGDIVGAAKAAGLRAHPTVGRTASSQLAKLTVNDIADFVVAPVDALVDDPKSPWKDKAPYVIRLGLERIEIVAGKEVTEVSGLEGKKVAIGPADSADEAVAVALFQRLGVKPDFVRKPLADALADLSAGKIAAVVATGETGSKALGDFGKDGKTHLVELPMTPTLAANYSPLLLTAKDRPNLVSVDQKVDTLGAPIALIAMDAPANSARAQRAADFVAALFDKFPTLMGADDDPNWRDVNIAATLDWPRLPAVDAWIAEHKGASDTAFAEFRKVAADDPAADPEKLFKSLMQARSAQP